MGDSYGDSQRTKSYQGQGTRDTGRGSFKGGRGGNNREGGGFRIRLSDNEMRSAKIIQEAFNLRSTVAVLGFALRTLGQMIEDGKLDDLVNQYRSQAPHDNFNRNQSVKGVKRVDTNSNTNSKPNPFARPAKPEPEAEPEATSNSEDSTSDKSLTTADPSIKSDEEIESSEKSKDKTIEANEQQPTTSND